MDASHVESTPSPKGSDHDGSNPEGRDSRMQNPRRGQRRRGGGRSAADEAAYASLRQELRAVSQETKRHLPTILATVPHCPPDGFLYRPPELPHLDPKYCPQVSGTKLQVLEVDTYDAAIALIQPEMATGNQPPPCVLNMASDRSPGGNWLGGARAQEEALCRRSSLIMTLQRRFYPVPSDAVIYSPTVVIFRESLKNGHGLLDLAKPETLPVVAVISMAAIRCPAVKTVDLETKYANPNDRRLTKEKMRTVLRLSAWKRHRRLVLGALGCGAFRNPNSEVAECWAEVFSEPEFQGGWWESVVFAVLDDTGGGKRGDGNYGRFFSRLEGMDI